MALAAFSAIGHRPPMAGIGAPGCAPRSRETGWIVQLSATGGPGWDNVQAAAAPVEKRPCAMGWSNTQTVQPQRGWSSTHGATGPRLRHTAWEGPPFHWQAAPGLSAPVHHSSIDTRANLYGLRQKSIADGNYPLILGVLYVVSQSIKSDSPIRGPSPAASTQLECLVYTVTCNLVMVLQSQVHPTRTSRFVGR